jgi:hypothetical protein
MSAVTSRKDFNAEPLFEEADVIFALCIKKQLQIKNRV